MLGLFGSKKKRSAGKKKTTAKSKKATASKTKKSGTVKKKTTLTAAQKKARANFKVKIAKAKKIYKAGETRTWGAAVKKAFKK